MTERPRPPGMDLETWRFQNMGEAIVRREVKIQRLRGVLARLEWAARKMDGDTWVCPACWEEKDRGRHDPGCWLAAELRTERT